MGSSLGRKQGRGSRAERSRGAWQGAQGRGGTWDHPGEWGGRWAPAGTQRLQGNLALGVASSRCGFWWGPKRSKAAASCVQSASVAGSAFAVIFAGENCVLPLRVFLRQQWGSCPVPALSGRHSCPFLGAPEHCQGLHKVSTTIQGVNAGSWGGEDLILILHKPRDAGHEWIRGIS